MWMGSLNPDAPFAEDGLQFIVFLQLGWRVELLGAWYL